MKQAKTLLVTGGAGFIGSQFIRTAMTAGYRVLVLDALTYAGHKANLDQPLKQDPQMLIEGNICDGKLVQSILSENQVDAIVNFAAESHVDRSISGPSEFINTNIFGTYNMIECALNYWRDLPGERRNHFRYVQVSTDEVYGALGETGYFNENSPLAPNSPYSASKASADLLVRAWHHTFGLPTITTNCSNNYGPRQFPEKLIPLMIFSALKQKPLPVYGNGSNVRDWIHVEDHSRGVLLALEKGKPGSTYCFGGRSERSNLDVVRQICRILDDLKPRSDGKAHETGITFVADRLGHDWRYAIDDSRAYQELGFELRHKSFEEGLANTIQWYLQNEEWLHAVSQRR